MSDRLRGLKLTRSERIIVVTLSYIVTAPLIWANGKRLIYFLTNLAAEARRQIREEDRQAEREQEQERRRGRA
jgi:hypothetical protein